LWEWLSATRVAAGKLLPQAFLLQVKIIFLEAGYGAQRHTLDNEIDPLLSFLFPL